MIVKDLKTIRAVVSSLFVLLYLAACGGGGGGGGKSDQRSDNTAQTTSVTFAKILGGDEDDWGSAVIQTAEDDYIIVGTTDVNPDEKEIDYEIYLIKLDANGNEVWKKTFGGSGNDTGESVYQTSDGGFIIAGSTTSFGSGQNVYLVKTDKDGNKEWESSEGRLADEEGQSVRQTVPDGGYVVVGSTNSFASGEDVYLLKTDMSGKREWDQHYGGSSNEWGNSVIQTSDGNFLIAASGEGVNDMYIIKVNASVPDEGSVLWQQSLGGTGYYYGNSVEQTSDGGYIITGDASIDGSNYDISLIKTKEDGSKIWEKTFGGTADPDHGYDVHQTTDGGFIITGVFANKDVYLIKTNENGEVIWSKTFDWMYEDFGFSVCETKDNGYIITGSTYNGSDDDLLIIKTDKFGNVNTK
ncbi:MAG: hypothetical protein C4538_00845 [Nitrospiraceae bacterium]|nr:MAG: hypothetical protein C4538_00845 [Nitrospiraceae bacterium]